MIYYIFERKSVQHGVGVKMNYDRWDAWGQAEMGGMVSIGSVNVGGTATPLILVVEDDESDRELAQRGLRTDEFRCRVEFAVDGQEAVDFLLDPGSEIPALILLDLKMPRLNGHEVLQRVRATERTKACPVVVFTSSGQAIDILGCFEKGANSFVRKATEFDQYIARLREVARYWLKVNEPCPGRAAR